VGSYDSGGRIGCSVFVALKAFAPTMSRLVVLHLAVATALSLVAISAAPSVQQKPQASGGHNDSTIKPGAKPTVIKADSGNHEPPNPNQSKSTDQQKRDSTPWLVIVGVAQTIALVATLMQMRREEKRRLRAYVHVEAISLRSHDSVDSGLEQMQDAMIPSQWPWCSMRIKNFGQTPAYDLVWKAIMEILPASGGGVFAVPESPGGSAMRGALPPGDTLTKFFGGTEVQATRENVSGLRAGTMSVYVHGDITYRDAFKKTRKTRFRYVHAPIPGGRGLMKRAEGDNEAD
jgi:hypothetical protein